MRLKFSFALLLAFSVCQVQAQLHYGFKTGLNFARFDGPSETDNAGKSLETWKNVTGFHIGAIVFLRFHRQFWPARRTTVFQTRCEIYL